MPMSLILKSADTEKFIFSMVPEPISKPGLSSSPNPTVMVSESKLTSATPNISKLSVLLSHWKVRPSGEMPMSLILKSAETEKFTFSIVPEPISNPGLSSSPHPTVMVSESKLTSAPPNISKLSVLLSHWNVRLSGEMPMSLMLKSADTEKFTFSIVPEPISKPGLSSSPNPTVMVSESKLTSAPPNISKLSVLLSHWKVRLSGEKPMPFILKSAETVNRIWVRLPLVKVMPGVVSSPSPTVMVSESKLTTALPNISKTESLLSHSKEIPSDVKSTDFKVKLAVTSMETWSKDPLVISNPGSLSVPKDTVISSPPILAVAEPNTLKTSEA